jgi:hypothetical protein
VRMARILEDVQVGADWISKALMSSGFKADFSPDSLIEIDRFFDRNAVNGKAVRGGLLSQDSGKRLFAIGCYVGEVIRRSAGGEWQGDDSDPDAEINVALRLPGGEVYWPVQRAVRRFTLGSGESITAYGELAGLHFTRTVWPDATQEESPSADSSIAKRPWWRFW